MPVERKYRGRVITLEDIAFLREFLDLDKLILPQG